MKMLTAVFLAALLSSCAGRAALNGNVRIVLPEPPKRIAVTEEGVSRKPGVKYIDPPVKVSPNERPRIPETGGALLSARSWRAVRYALTEWPKWGEAVRSIVDTHNQAAGPSRSTKSWWSAWWQ